MSCCKSKIKDEHEIADKNELNSTGRLLKIPTAIFISALLIILSPFLLLYLWFLIIQATFEYNSSIYGVLNHFMKKKIKEEDVVDEDEFNEDEFNEDDYELVGVETIK